MAEMKIRPAKRVAGKSKFRLPERTLRIAEINPLRELLQEAKAQEAAIINESINKMITPVNESIDKETISVNESADKENTIISEPGDKENTLVNEFIDKVALPVIQIIDEYALPAIQIIDEYAISVIQLAGIPQSVVLNQASEIADSKDAAKITPSSDVPPRFKNKRLFNKFLKKWSSSLRCGNMKVCQALFKMTYGIGKKECFTSMPKLAAAAGLKERQCYIIVANLENLGFVERTNIYNTPDKRGTIFRLNLTPQVRYGTGPRYHIGSKNIHK